MNRKIRKIIWSLLICIIFLTSVIFASSDREDPKRKEALEDRELILSIELAGDIEKLKKLSDELEKKWSEKNVENYIIVVSSISKSFNDNKNYAMGDKYAKLALDKLFELPEEQKVRIEGELSLLWKINHDILNPFRHIQNLAKEKDWSQKRREAAKYYFLVWERLEKEIDSDWDPNDKSNPNDFPRPSARYKGPGASGMSPDSIEDPEIRAEYEAALNKYWERVRYRSKQYSLRRIKDSDLHSLQRHILGLYSGPEFDSKNLEIDALKKDIAVYVEDEKIREIMLEGLKNRIIEDAKPPKRRILLSDRTTILDDAKQNEK